MRVPRLVRTPLLVGLLLLLHVGLGGPIEKLRLALFTALSRGAALAEPLTVGERPRPEAPSDAARDARRRATRLRLARFGDDAGRVARVFEVDARRGWLLVGAGRKHGVERGALVHAPDGVIGIVDRVEIHLARVRLLTARDARLAVRVRPKRALPGEIDGIVGALQGHGKGAQLTRMSASDLVRAGDALEVLGRGDLDGLAVGVVADGEAVKDVRLGADVAAIERVLIEGVSRAASAGELFRRIRARTRFEPGHPRGEALLTGADTHEVALGSAVLSGPVYLGRIVGRVGGWLQARRFDAPGKATRLALMREDGAEHGVSVTARAGGGFALASERQSPWPAAYAFTAAGDQLVPSGLYVGRFRAQGTDAALIEGPATGEPWPDEVEVAAFLRADERDALLGRRR